MKNLGTDTNLIENWEKVNTMRHHWSIEQLEYFNDNANPAPIAIATFLLLAKKIKSLKKPCSIFSDRSSVWIKAPSAIRKTGISIGARERRNEGAGFGEIRSGHSFLLVLFCDTSPVSRRGISINRLINLAIPSDAILLQPPTSKPVKSIVERSMPNSPATVSGPGVGGIRECAIEPPARIDRMNKT